MKKLIAFLLAFLFISSASAEITFPADLTAIEDEAFRGDALLEELTIPDGVTSIGSYAFADCPALRQVTVPAGVTSLGEGAFSGSELPVLLLTDPGSATVTHALSEGLDFQADTAYRALLIGQCNYSYASVLHGTLTDVATMETILTGFSATPYDVSVRTDLSADGICAAIRSTFGNAREQDVSLFFYSGHGAYPDGALCGVDDTYLPAAQLRACLDEIPGRKIVLVDACHSGALIGKSTASTSNSAFISSFMSAFRSVSRSTNLAASQYYVITAAHSSETSAEMYDGTRYFGAFTTALARGCGYDYLFAAPCENYADTNQDGVITLQEAFIYARSGAAAYNPSQTAQVWPSTAGRFGFLRE